MNHTIVFTTTSEFDAAKFKKIIDIYYPSRGANYYVKALQGQGRGAKSYVFYLALGRVAGELFDVLRTEVWLGHSMYWHESDNSLGPEIVVCGEYIHEYTIRERESA